MIASLMIASVLAGSQPTPQADVRQMALAALEQCYAFQVGGGSSDLEEWLDGVGFTPGQGAVWYWSVGAGGEAFDIAVGYEGTASGARACGLQVMTRPVDSGLMEEALEAMRRHRRGFTRSEQNNGLPCTMQSVSIRDRRIHAQASCDRLAAAGQPGIVFRLDSPSGL